MSRSITESEAPKLAYIDSHVHLWLQAHATAANHRWMADPHASQFTRQYSIEDYDKAVDKWSQESSVPTDLNSISGSTRTAVPTTPARHRGFVFVETDPAVAVDDRPGGSSTVDETYSAALSELRFLDRIVQGSPTAGEGHHATDSKKLLGIVMWAPMNESRNKLREYLDHVQNAWMSPALRDRVKGVRYLVQGYSTPESFSAVVDSKDFEDCLQEVSERDLIFEVGVDQAGGGDFQLTTFVEMVERIRRRGIGTPLIFGESFL